MSEQKIDEKRLSEIEARAWGLQFSSLAGGLPLEVSALVADLRDARAARVDADRRRDVMSAALLMVGSEACGDPKMDPHERGDPRWTPTLAEVARLRAERDEALAEIERLRRELERRARGSK